MIRLSDILKESNIEDYPEFYQKWYKTHYDIGGKERAERYLKTLPPAKELKKRKEFLQRKIYLKKLNLVLIKDLLRLNLDISNVLF